MIRCPTCGLELPPTALACPKDGTRLSGSQGPSRAGLETVLTDPGSQTWRQGRSETPMEVEETPLGTEKVLSPNAVPKTVMTPQVERVSGKRPTAMAERERATGGRAAKAGPALAPEPRSGAALKGGAAVAELERPRNTGGRPALAAPVQPLPVTAQPAAKNPWGDENSGTDSTLKRVHDTPQTQPGPVSDPLIGQQLGEYKVLELLGQGGMGIVYRGEQPLIGKQVAIKVLRPELAQDPRQMQRLLEEARVVNAVRHPGLIDIFSFGELPDGGRYFVMELLEGQSLEELLQVRGRMKAWEAVPILEEAMAALDAAHEAGVIHRDLKPSNIFLIDLPDHTRRVKLLDFGLAKRDSLARGSTPQTMNVVVGTPEYMAPEQARAHEVSPRTDLYAMGIVAYELLTGNVPFSTESAVETMMMQLDVMPKSPGELEPTVPEPLEKLVMRMLQKRPEDRPASAAEVKRELGRIKKQLTQAETQISMAAVVAAPSVSDTAEVERVSATRPAVDTRPSAAPPASKRGLDKTEAMEPLRDLPEPERAETDPLFKVKGKPSLFSRFGLPALAVLATLGLLAAGYVFFAGRGQDEVVVPPPPLPTTPSTPAKPVVAPEATAPEKSLPEAEPKVTGPQETVKKVDSPKPPKKVDPPRPKGHSKEETQARIDKFRASLSANPQLPGRTAMELGLKNAEAQLKAGTSPDEVWKNLEPYAATLR